MKSDPEEVVIAGEYLEKVVHDIDAKKAGLTDKIVKVSNLYCREI